MAAKKLQIGTHVILIVVTMLVVYPVIFMVLNALKTGPETALSPFSFPAVLQWDNFAAAWQVVAPAFTFTFWIEVISVLGTLITSLLSAYAFAKLTFFGRRIVFMAIFGLLLIPGFLSLIPLFLEVKDFDMLNSGWGLVLPYIAGGQAFNIFVLRGYMETLPGELFEAAQIDGANHWQQFWRIATPLSIPILITLALMQIVGIYGDYVFPSLVLNSSQQTVALAIASFTPPPLAPSINAVNMQLAAFTLSSIPIAVLFFLLMPYFVKGMTSGALKM